MLRLIVFIFPALIAAAACVPTEDKPSGQDAQAQPQEPARTPRLARQLPSANPFVPDAASAEPTAVVSETPPAQAGDARAPVAAKGDAAAVAVRKGDGGAHPTTGKTIATPPGPVAANKPAAPAAPPAAPDSAITTAYVDTFDRADLGPEWNATSPEWKIQGGRLCVKNAHNHPAWLKRKLPTNARLEFDATSTSPDGDLKVEVWGDGKSAATGDTYNNATSYIAIFGGWHNQFHVLAKVDEHAPNRPEVKIDPSGADFRARPVRQGAIYHFKIERSDGKTVRWLVDDIEIHAFADPEPFKGAGHEHLGFNDWEVAVCFDNLQIVPLAGG